MKVALWLLTAALCVTVLPWAGAAECVGPKLTEKQVLQSFHAELAKRGTKLPTDWTVTVSDDKCHYMVFAEGPPSERGSHFAYWLDRSGKVIKVFHGR
jgi:hypothetical protein